MMTPAAEHDLTPVLPRRYRSFFFLLAGLLGLQLYAALLPMSAALGQLQGEMGLSAGDQRLMIVLLCGAAMALVWDGSTRLCAQVSLVWSALGVTAPVYAAGLPVEAAGFRWVLAITLCFALPAMLQAGPKKTRMRRLTFGVALMLLVETVLQLVTWLAEWLVMQGAEWFDVPGHQGRPYIAVVVALPLLVWLLFWVQRRPLPDLSDLVADREGGHPVAGDARAAVSCPAPSGGAGSGAAGVPAAPQALPGGKRNRLSALMLLTLGVVGAFVWGGDDPALEVARRCFAWLLVLLYVVWYAPCLRMVLCKKVFWLVFVLLMLLLFPGVCWPIVPAPIQYTPLVFVAALVGCLLGCWLMRRGSPQRVALVCLLLVLLVQGATFGTMLALVMGMLEVDASGWVASGLTVLWYLGETGIIAAVTAVAYCGLVTWGLGSFPARLGGLAMGVLLALLGVVFA